MKKIMVPTDFSEHSKNAANYAVELARKFQAHLTLFHAFTLSPSTVYPPLYSAGHPGSPTMQEEVIKAEKQSRQRLEAFRDLIMKDQKEPCCSIVQRGGFVSESINEFAQEKDFDMIVMSTRGHESASDLFISTNTWDVINSGNTTVMAIPEKLPYTPLNHFAFATDFSDADLSSLNTILEIASKFKARVSVVHIRTKDEDSSQDQVLLKRLEKKATSAFPYKKIDFHLLDNENIGDALNDFAAKHKVNLLALVNRKHNVFKRLFHRSLTKKFAFHSEIPLMVFAQSRVQKDDKTKWNQKTGLKKEAIDL